jgi:hypothetical protein
LHAITSTAGFKDAKVIATKSCRAFKQAYIHIYASHCLHMLLETHSLSPMLVDARHSLSPMLMLVYACEDNLRIVAHVAMLNADHTCTCVVALVQAKHGILASPVPPRRGGGGGGGGVASLVASLVPSRAQSPHAPPQSARVQVHGVVGTLGTAHGDGRTTAGGDASVHSLLPTPLPPGGGEGGMTPGSIFKRIASRRRMVTTSKEGGEAAEQDMLEYAQGRVSLAPSPRCPGRGRSQSPARLLESLASSPLRPVLTALGLAQPVERYSTLFACKALHDQPLSAIYMYTIYVYM